MIGKVYEMRPSAPATEVIILGTLDASTLLIDAKGSIYSIPRQETTYYVQPAIYNNHFDTSTVVDLFSDCNYVTFSNIPTDLVISKIFTTTVLPND